MAAIACGDDDFGPYGGYPLVGGACRGDLECAPGVDCHRGGDFPGGTCAFSCDHHVECPRGSACVDVQGGICLAACTHDTYCRRDYKCKRKHDRDGSGDSLVCIK
jgi:hypothetical protein